MNPKPWIQEASTWEVHTTGDVVICCAANKTIEIEKLYGPLVATPIRIRLEYRGDMSDWVVETMTLSSDQWVEKARWDCQEESPGLPRD